MFEKFVYDGTMCSEYGIICAYFGKEGLITPEAQKTDLKTEQALRGNTFNIISQDYSEPLSYTMQIVNKDFSPITSIQERALKKWLCQRGKYNWFCILNERYADTWFYANISNPKMEYFYGSFGMELTINTDAPYAYSDPRTVTANFKAGEILESLYVDNDEEMPIYPVLTITPANAGTITLKNLSLPEKDNTLIIKNCTAGEVITLDCNMPLAISSNQNHNIYNDFNLWWPYLIDGYNRITADKDCVVKLEYREYRKVGIV